MTAQETRPASPPIYDQHDSQRGPSPSCFTTQYQYFLAAWAASGSIDIPANRITPRTSSEIAPNEGRLFILVFISFLTRLANTLTACG